MRSRSNWIGRETLLWSIEILIIGSRIPLQWRTKGQKRILGGFFFNSLQFNSIRDKGMKVVFYFIIFLIPASHNKRRWKEFCFPSSTGTFLCGIIA